MAIRTEPRKDTNYTQTYKNIAIIDIIGPIVPRVRGMSSGSVGAQQIRNDFIAAFESEDIKGILLNVDSPGGDARGISELAQTIQRARDKNTKPIYAYAAGWMASAAYFISAASHRIVANDWASVGSIGVVIGVPPQLPDDNIEFVSTTSPYKRPDHSTDAGKKIYQDKADYMGQLFIEAVAELRGVTTEKVINDFGKGGTLVGKQAKSAGLVDAIGTFDSTLRSLITSKALDGNQTVPAANAGSPLVNPEALVRDFGAMGAMLIYQKAAEAGLASRTGYQILSEFQDANDLGSLATSPAAATECKCCANDSKNCGCASKDQTGNGICSCGANCAGCMGANCGGKMKSPAMNAGGTHFQMEKKPMTTEKTKGFFATMFAKLTGDEREEALAELGVEVPRADAVAPGVNIYTMSPPVAGTLATIRQPHAFIGDPTGVCTAPDCGEKSDSAAHDEPAEMKDLRAKAALAEKYKTQIEALRVAEAEAFAGSLVIAHTIMPAGKDMVAALYLQHARDDEASPLVAGADGVKPMSRVDQFKGMFGGVPKHSLTSEFISADMPTGAFALNPDAGNGSEEESLKAAEASAREYAARNNPKPKLEAVN
jgi:signal peptide peptidase SppA